MLNVEVDLFSGRPNPQWIITDPDATKDLLGNVAAHPEAIARPGAGFLGLGFREVVVRQLADDPSLQVRVPRIFALGSAAAADYRQSAELALGLVERSMAQAREVRLLTHELTPISPDMQGVILERMQLAFRLRPDISKFFWPSTNPLISTVNDERCMQCQYEVSQFNPNFWNAPAVQPHNNCYNYARNWRTDTFAQPGRAHGAQTSTMSCPTVTAAAMADGLVRRCTCLPSSEWPRRLMALVVDPGVDYHWYRHQRGGFWGHKPGNTEARNVDNRNVVITNPETCDRGGYTDFCDYFYAGRSVVIN